MELIMNIIVYIVVFLGFLVTFITISGECIIIDSTSKDKSYYINKNIKNNKKIRYYKK